MDRFHSKFDVFFGMAANLADLSTCKRAQVGCVIVPYDFSRVYSIGYNGPPVGQENDACQGTEGSCGCVHAEANAIVKLWTQDWDSRLLCTTFPCPTCASIIANKELVTMVVYDRVYRSMGGRHILEAAGIETRHITEVRDAGATEWRKTRSRRHRDAQASGSH